MRCDLAVGPRPQIGEGDVVDGHLHAFGRPPILGVLVEPDVVRRDEMAPLKDLERLLRALDPDRRTQRGGHGRPGGRRHELAPIHPLSLRHDPTLRWLKERSEEHTSELQSLAYLVCRLLLEKKKKRTTQQINEDKSR